jgi:probable addiction module antidote protein
MTLLATLREDIMKLKRFDATDFLDSDEAMVEYLNAALEEDDPRYFAHALGNVARAKGMSSISEGSGLGRQALYRALSSEGNPRIDTLFRVLDTLDLRLAITRQPS